ncbi:uncharacterized protein LOC117564263 isoform X3 [Drosophila albomicans]|uniref:Uncharacterized protein LOC117564263 isoform X3 n=1 Tax=Drosophila albomicans TaxID=7291 RepID=A0A9C6SMC0_DROAB|nr:uncharacterized protein LOC117564263 isoform X3 [Drosophila albomicans]
MRCTTRLTNAKNGLNGLTCAAFKERKTKDLGKKLEMSKPSADSRVVGKNYYAAAITRQLSTIKTSKENGERREKNLPPEMCLKGDNPDNNYRESDRVFVWSLDNGSMLVPGYDQMQQRELTQRQPLVN